MSSPPPGVPCPHRGREQPQKPGWGCRVLDVPGPPRGTPRADSGWRRQFPAIAEPVRTCANRCGPAREGGRKAESAGKTKPRATCPDPAELPRTAAVRVSGEGPAATEARASRVPSPGLDSGKMPLTPAPPPRERCPRPSAEVRSPCWIRGKDRAARWALKVIFFPRRILNRASDY